MLPFICVMNSSSNLYIRTSLSVFAHFEAKYEYVGRYGKYCSNLIKFICNLFEKCLKSIMGTVANFIRSQWGGGRQNNLFMNIKTLSTHLPTTDFYWWIIWVGKMMRLPPQLHHWTCKYKYCFYCKFLYVALNLIISQFITSSISYR